MVLCLPAAHGAQQPTDKFSGTYRIQGWRDLERRGMHHFFYLHPSGHFLLGAAWPGHETSRFAGLWNVAGDRLTLTGAGRVDTNQGAWRTDFRRTYLISVEGDGFWLLPVLEKNRYGMIGWPNPFRFHRRQPRPNLPGGDIPAAEAGILRHILKMIASHRGR